ncbi:MAG: threonine synthase [Terriglobia bacterium]
MATSTLTHLKCARCRAIRPADAPQNLCSCGAPLLAQYDLAEAATRMMRATLAGRGPGLWRYAEVLPGSGEAAVSLGEGSTPLVEARRLGEKLGCPKLYVKDESSNPTGTFKARGLAVAVTRARELGLRKLAIPTAGNAGGALAAYASHAGLEAYVLMPRDAPAANQLECRLYGAELILVEGLIGNCARVLAERKEKEGWFDVSTLKEPYRVEGKKTLGYEMFEQLGGRLPDVILYPTGGGVGLIGMWKAFSEMEEMGWIGLERPKMIAVQAAGCAPIVKAFAGGRKESEVWPNPQTVAAGLRVPKALGDFLILEALYQSRGTAVAVEEAELLAGVRELAEQEGIFACPEGAATLAALRKLLAAEFLRAEETIVLCNTGTGLKYLDVLETS